MSARPLPKNDGWEEVPLPDEYLPRARSAASDKAASLLGLVPLSLNEIFDNMTDRAGTVDTWIVPPHRYESIAIANNDTPEVNHPSTADTQPAVLVHDDTLDQRSDDGDTSP